MTGYLVRSMTVLNVVIFCAALLFGYYIVLPPFIRGGGDTLPVSKNAAAVETKETSQPVTLNAFDYTVIAEQNLFHPERKIPIEKKDVKPLPKPEFVLYGVLITEDTSLVYMEDKKAPRSTPGRGKRMNVLRINGTLSGFTLKDIRPDSIVMVRGNEKITVLLSESRSKKQTQPNTTNRPHQPIPPNR
jgi:type II secretory pathway component PulC